MKKKQFKVISLFTTMIMGAVIGFSVSIGNPILAVSSFLAGMAIMYLSKRRLEGVVEDERIRQISQKASWITLQFIALSFSIIGAALVAMRNTYPRYTDLGFFMAYVSCAVLALYSLFYMYYNREYGG
jgi:uncharacterized membrane protein